MGAFEQKYGIPAADAPSFEQKYGLADEPAPPAPTNLAAADTASTMSRAMNQGATELSRAGYGRGGKAPTDEEMKSSRESPTRIIPALKAMGTLTKEQLIKQFRGLSARNQESYAERVLKHGTRYDPLDYAQMDLPPDEQETKIASTLATAAEINAAADLREAARSDQRSAAAIPADATEFEKNVIQGGASGLASAATLLGSTALTGSPVPGVGLMAAGSAGSRYADVRNANLDAETARPSSDAAGALAWLTELIPGETLVKKSPIGKKIVSFLLTDILGENITSGAQLVDDYRLQMRDDITAADIQQTLKDTTIQTIIGGGVQLTAAQAMQAIVDKANEKAAQRLNDEARADINRGANIPSADDLVANLDASDAEFDHPQLEAPKASGGGFRADAAGNVRPETEAEAFHVEQAANAREEARARIEKRIQADVDRASSVKRLPAPDTSKSDLIVGPSGEARPQTQNEANAADAERARQRDLGMSPTRVPIEDADAQMHAALAAAKEGNATPAQTKAILDEKLGKRNTGGTLILLPAGRRKLKALSEGTGKERGNAIPKTDLPAVVAGATPAAKPADGPAGAVGTGREDAALKHHDSRLEDADRMEAIQRLRGDIGAWEKGGRLMRADGDQGEVTGRTTHIASDLWKNRPANESGTQISAEKATEALDRMKAGKELSPSQQKYVTYLLDEQDAIAAEWKAFQEKEAPRHEAEIVEVIPEFKAQPDDAQTITALAKVAAQYSTEEELEHAMEAQDDGEAMRRLQRLVDRGWLQPQDEEGETNVTAKPEKELAGNATTGAGQPRSSEESRQAEAPAKEEVGRETDLLGNDAGATAALNKQQSKVDKKLGKGKKAPKPEDAPAGDIFRAQADKEDAENAAKQTDIDSPPVKTPVSTGEESGATEEETKEIGAQFDALEEHGNDEDGTITHVFDKPAKGEVVRLNDKAKAYHKDHGWMSVADAKKRIEEWKANAAAQGDLDSNPNAQKVVLSLFDLTGAWSQPWVDAGYNVWRFDIQDDPEVGDVNNFSTEFFNDWFGSFDGMDVYAILAACPCTDFAVSGARHFAAKDADGRTHSSVELVTQTLATIEYFKPAVWAIENPVGRIESLTGLPPWRLSFDPNHLGDPYTKKTLIWGRFNADLPVAPVEPTEGSKMHAKYGGKSQKTKNARSATPEGFSYGFFMANNAIDHPEMAVHGKFDRLDRPTIAAALKRGVTVEQITEAVEDFYYQDLDDAAANAAIAKLEPKKPEPPAEKPAAKKASSKASNKAVDDAGEKIGGARKDQWKERGLSLDDLESMTDSEAATIVKKQAVWKPDYEKLIEAGASPKAAALIKVVYDKLGASPRANTPEGRKHYVEMMRAVRDNYEGAKTDKDVEDAARKIHDAAGLTPELARMTYNNPERLAAVTKLFSIMKGRSSVFSIGYTEKRAADKLLEKGFPNAQPWTSRFNIREQLTSGLTPEGADYYMQRAEEAGTPLASKELLLKSDRLFTVSAKGTGRTVGYALTKGGAVAIAQKAYGEVKSKKADGELPERPHLDTLKREGPERRKADITPDDFLAAFGFRGVEFGNWAANDERQKLLNLSFDALHDLAEIVGIPANAISLNGTLGLALAARGSGKALAHYESGKLVINLTKIRGAGTLAHEWAHALDHYFGELERPDAYKTSARGATGWYKNPNSKTRENLRPEMARAWHAVTAAIRGVAGESNYFKQAKRLSGKSGADGYWARPTEMFARAFESFVFDKIKALGRESDYLVHAVEADRYASDKYKGNPYPTGEERVAINKAMEGLVAGFEQVQQPDDITSIRQDAATYGEVKQREVVKSAKGQLSLDLFTAKPQLPATKRAIKTLSESMLVSVGTLKVGTTKINDWQAAAHVIASIRKSPQEKFVSVVLDKDNNLLAVLQHGLGTTSGAAVELWTAVGSAARIPGAAQIYFAHNHPNGNVTQSAADNQITLRIQNLLRQSGIKAHGMIVVSPNVKFASFFSADGALNERGEIPLMLRDQSIDIEERRIKRHSTHRQTIGSLIGHQPTTTTQVETMAADLYKQGITSGIMVFDRSMKLSDVIEMSGAEMGQLRTRDVNTGILGMLARFENASSEAAIIFGDNTVNMHNVHSALAEAMIEVADVVVGNQNGFKSQKAARSLTTPLGGYFYAKGPREGTRMTKGAVESAIEPVLLNVNDMGIDVIVAATPYHLPKELYDSLYDEGALDQVKGIFIHDADGPVIHLIASNIRDQWHAREIVIHELAHYGIHNLMGADEYARVMDDLWKRFPDIVKAAGRRNNIDMSGSTGQRTAAEEAVAYASARLVDGETLEVPERSMLKRVFDAIRNFLAKMWPKFAIADRELADILRNAMASLTVAQKERAPEERVVRRAADAPKPPAGTVVNVAERVPASKKILTSEEMGRVWYEAEVSTSQLSPLTALHNKFAGKSADEMARILKTSPPILEWAHDTFEVLDGNHRVAAAKAAGLKKITAVYSVRQTAPRRLLSREAPIFYSALVRAAQDAKTQKATPAQWLATFRNTPGVKQEEIEWTGLEEWLNRQTSNSDPFVRDLLTEGQMLSPAERKRISANPGMVSSTITKQEVADFLAANQITVKEQVSSEGDVSDERKTVNNAVVRLTALGLTPEIIEDQTTMIDFVTDENENVAYQWNVKKNEWVDTLEGETARISTEQLEALTELQDALGHLSINEMESEAQTMYADWQTPGGTGYREMVLQVPLPPFAPLTMMRRKAIFEKWQPKVDAARAKMDAAKGAAAIARADEERTAIEGERDLEANLAGPERSPYISHHWNNEENIVAHVRFNERTDADGKRVLFIQEIQSDWHQAGRKRGYGKPLSWKVTDKSGQFQRYFENTEDGEKEARAAAAKFDGAVELVRRDDLPTVPDAPFKTTWPELAFKRMVRWASEHGFERIAWATGEMNADVFSLEHQVSEITWFVADDNARTLKIHMDGRKTIQMDFDESGVITSSGDGLEGKSLGEVIGEDLAKKVLAKKEGHAAGGDLKMGGEGMRGFYDKMLPQMAAKIGKKWGAKVGQTTIRGAAKEGVAWQDLKEKDVAQKVHSMDVTPAMRDAAMVGQPLFSRRWSANAMGRGAGIKNGRPAFDLPEGSPWSSWWNYIVYQMQNKFYDLFRTQKDLAAYRAMVNLPEAEDANLKQTLYHGRAEKRVADFMEQFIENPKNPAARTLAKLMKEADKVGGTGFSWQNVEDWLYARHAKEANAHLLKINKGDPKFNSGMSDVEADAILGSFVHPILDEIGALVDRMTAWTRNNLVTEGLEDPATVAAWEATYKHYVPLKGWKDDPDLAEMPRVGKGFDTGGNAKRRTGRTSRGDAILANVVANAQASIIRGEKAKVGRALYEMLKNTDAPNLWSVDEVEYVRYVDPRDGLVRQVLNPGYVLAPNVVRVRIGGKDFHITFNPQNESMLRLAEAFKNLSNEKVGKIAAVFLGINRYLSTMNTTLTPEFVITNALRDIQTALISIGTNDIAGLRAKMLGNWKDAARGIWNKERGDGTHPWAATWEEFQNEGGKVGWLDHYKSAVDLEKKLQGLVEPDGTIKMTMKGFGAALKLVEDLNMSVENAIRLAAYQAAKDSGVSKPRAAEIAKNLTVNFNRKGNMGTAMNAAYLFYNAAVQGTSVVWGAVKNPKTRKLVYLLVAAGIAMDIVNRIIGDTDPDKEKRYDKISEHDKESNMILMLPPGMRFHMPSGDEVSYLKVPLPYGFNTFYYAGTKIGGIVDHVAIGNKRVVKPMEDATLIGTAFFNAFSPVGGQSGSPIQAIAPTLVDPFVQIWENKNWTGNPIMPVDRPFENPLPDSERYFKSATQPARDMAHWLNAVSGGTEISPGGVDISPETVDHFWDFALGGLGRFASGTMNTAHDVIVKPEDLSLREVPFLRRIAGEIGNRYIQDKFYEHVTEVGYAHDEYEKALDMKRGSEDFLEQQQYVRDRYPVAVEMINDLKSTTRVIRKARKETKRLEERKGKMLEEKRSKGLDREKDFIQNEMDQFNKRWNEVEDSKMGERQKGRDITSSVGSLVDGKSKREAVASLRDAGLPATAALLWELPMSSSKAITEWFERDSARA